MSNQPPSFSPIPETNIRRLQKTKNESSCPNAYSHHLPSEKHLPGSIPARSRTGCPGKRTIFFHISNPRKHRFSPQRATNKARSRAHRKPNILGKEAVREPDLLRAGAEGKPWPAQNQGSRARHGPAGARICAFLHNIPPAAFRFRINMQPPSSQPPRLVANRQNACRQETHFQHLPSSKTKTSLSFCQPPPKRKTPPPNIFQTPLLGKGMTNGRLSPNFISTHACLYCLSFLSLHLQKH